MRTRSVRTIAGVFLAAATAWGAETYVEADGWRWNNGDDLRWADPTFDDSGWARMDNFRPGEGRTSAGMRWYRTCFAVPDRWQGWPLSFTLPQVDFAFEAYANGQPMGGFGRIANAAGRGGAAVVVFHRPLAVSQDALARGGAKACFALRSWSPGYPPDRSVVVLMPDRLERHRARLGIRESIEAEEALHRMRATAMSLSNNGLRALVFSAGLLLLALFWRQRDHREYLWFALSALCTSLGGGVGLAAWLTDSLVWNNWGVALWGIVTFRAASIPLYFYLRERLPARFSNWLLAAVLLSATTAVAQGLHLPGRETADAISTPLLGLIVAGSAFYDFQRRDWENTLLACAIGLRVVFFVLLGLSSDPMLGAGPFLFHFANVGQALITMTLLGVLIVRYRREERRKRAVQEEMAAGARAQALLLEGSAEDDTPGFVVERAYLPAREVGGDFYLVRALSDGELLVLVGDVSGKGLEAALLAAGMLVAARSVEDANPAEVLRRLNDAAAGGSRRGGFVTCCCVLLRPDGSGELASAGHPAPWVDGREVEVEAGLPLGVIRGVEYSQTRVRLGEGSLVTLVSDGVVEAADAKGELFGFERTREVSGKSAAAIADAARAWGQTDDITVVTVRRAVA